jgi:hypothetical protein
MPKKWEKCPSKVYLDVDGHAGGGVSISVREYLECKLNASHRGNHRAHLMLKSFSLPEDGGLATVQWRKRDNSLYLEELKRSRQ